MRNLSGWQRWLVGGWLVTVVLFHLYTAMFGVMEPRLQRGIHLIFLLPAAFLLFPATKKSPRDRITITDAVLAVLAVIPALYLLMEADRLTLRLDYVSSVSNTEMILGLLNISLLIEAIRRAVIPAMAIIVAVFLGYMFVGRYFPGAFYSAPISLHRIVEQQYLVIDAGIYGSITGISATFVALFVIFAAFMQVTKTGEFFTTLSSKIAGATRGGPAKIAVFSSALFGSICGSAAANVYATGTFTIPLMKKVGYRKQFAGAAESAASTGGQLLPPVMGAGAFVMAEITGTSYLVICVAAVIGAVLYFSSVLIMVHFTAVKEGLRGIDRRELPSLSQILRDSYLLIPLIGLVYFLLTGYSAFMAAALAILLTFIISFLSRKTMMTPRRLWETLELGGKNLVLIALSLAGAGVIVSVITNTGLGLMVSAGVVSWSGGILFPALLLIMMTSLILGMGLPVVAAYVIAVIVGGPALVAMGVDLLSAHLFVFYFAIFSGVTPPVCIAAFCGAALAGSDPIRTGFEALKLSLAGFIIPYVFVYNSALLMRGSALEILTAVVLVAAAIIVFAAGMIGYLTKKINIPARILCIGMATSLLISVCFSPLWLNLAVVGIIASPLLLIQVVRQVKRMATQRILPEEASRSKGDIGKNGVQK